MTKAAFYIVRHVPPYYVVERRVPQGWELIHQTSDKAKALRHVRDLKQQEWEDSIIDEQDQHGNSILF
jgi:uncharacterized protein YbdZ (MbtH family)